MAGEDMLQAWEYRPHIMEEVQAILDHLPMDLLEPFTQNNKLGRMREEAAPFIPLPLESMGALFTNSPHHPPTYARHLCQRA